MLADILLDLWTFAGDILTFLMAVFGLACAVSLGLEMRPLPNPWRDPDRDETACTLPDGWDDADDADEELAAAAREMAEAETVEMEAVI